MLIEQLELCSKARADHSTKLLFAFSLTGIEQRCTRIERLCVKCDVYAMVVEEHWRAHGDFYDVMSDCDECYDIYTTSILRIMAFVLWIHGYKSAVCE